MKTDEIVIIVDKDAAEGVARRDEFLDEDKTHVRVRLPDGAMILVAKTLFGDGDGRRYELPMRFAEVRTLAHEAAEAQPEGAARRVDGESLVIPVIEETMVVGKRAVENIVRISKTVEERQVSVDETFTDEQVEVERIPVDREVDGPVSIRYEGDTIIVPVLEEVIVVEKRLRLREEVRIRKRRIPRTYDEPVTLRREEVHVKRTSADGAHS